MKIGGVQVEAWAQQYRETGEYTEDQIQEWLQQMIASAAPAQQAGWEVGAEATYEGSGVAADSFDAQTAADPSSAAHLPQSWEAQEQLGTEGVYAEAGPAGGYGGDALEDGEAEGLVGDLGFGPGGTGTVPGTTTGETMVVQQDVTTYYNETYQFNPQGPQGVSQGGILFSSCMMKATDKETCGKKRNGWLSLTHSGFLETSRHCVESCATAAKDPLPVF